MPILFGWLSSIFTSIFSIFSAMLAARTAAIAAVVTISLALTAALFLVIKGLVAGLVAVVPYEPLVMGFWSVWPSNAEVCISACLGADIAVFIYRYKVGLVEALGR